MATSPPLSAPSASSNAIDARRAQQLAERALALSERGDLQGAILACRQSIALDPTGSQGFSMLGLLLERGGDSQGAIKAYERVLELAPESLLERESLGRLRTVATQRRSTQDLFAFDDNELFEDERPDTLPARDNASGDGISRDGAAPDDLTPLALGADVQTDAAMLRAAQAQDTASQDVPAPTVFTLAQSDETSLPVAPDSSADVAARGATLPVAASTPAASIPATTPASKAFEIPAVAPLSSAPATSVAPPSLLSPPPSITRAPGHSALGRVAPAMEYVPPAQPSALQKLWARPSYYFRGAPLAVTTVVSLMFLLWAHNYADSRDLPSVSNGDATTVEPTPNTTENPDTSAPRPSTPASGAKTNAANGNASVSRVPSNPNPITTAATSANSGAPSTATPATPSNPNPSPAVSSGAPSATLPGPTPPSATRPAGSASTGSASTPGATGVTAPTSPAGANGSGGAPASTPAASGAASANGVPIPIGGAPGRGFTRVASGTGAAPPRASIRAARDERTAAAPTGNAGNAGNNSGGNANSGAIESLTRAIDAGGNDVAPRLQQRAQLYLSGGDSARATGDFQGAISAYNDMINRGDRVALARAGIASCQRGIQIAQSRAAGR